MPSSYPRRETRLNGIRASSVDGMKQHDDALSQIAAAIGLTREELEMELAQDALAGLRERGRATYRGARKRRLHRKCKLAATRESVS
jgi:hypothetical protein